MHPWAMFRRGAAAGAVAVLALSFVALEPSAAAPGDGPSYVISGYDAARTSGEWGLTESYLTPTRDLVTDGASFGPGGTVPATFSVDGTGVSVVDGTNLTGVDVFFTGYVASASYTGAEKAALIDWVEAGGALIATVDHVSFDMSDALGMTLGAPADNTVQAPDVSDHPFFDGPFGTVSSVTFWGDYAEFSDVGPATPLMSDDNGDPTISVIPAGVLAPTAGPVVVVPDVDVFSQFTAPSNEDFVQNVFAWIAAELNDAPEVSVDVTDTAGDVGDTVTVNGTFTDPEEDLLALTCSDCPAAADFTDNGDGTWTLEIVLSEGDELDVTVTATDAFGATAIDTFVLSANAVAPPSTGPTTTTSVPSAIPTATPANPTTRTPTLTG